MRRKLSTPGLAAVAAVLLLAGALVPLGTASAESSVTLAVLGETHGTRTVTKGLADQAAAKGATGCVCPGDFIYGDWDATPSGWRDMMRPFMGTMLPAQGNHDHPWSDWSSIFPGGQRYYSKDVNGVQFISLNVESHKLESGSTQRVWLEKTLAERDPDALKVVFLHRPWWLPDGARHSYPEFEQRAGTSKETMDSLMRQHGVDLVVSGHEKNYQHSYRDGVHYVVQGSTGPEWDRDGTSYHLPGAVKRLSSSVGSILKVTPTGMTFESFDKHGGFVESFTMGGQASAPAPSQPAPSGSPDVQFAKSTGNEWWVQVDLDGADESKIAKVDAMDTNGPWVQLENKGWGWATSFHVEPGHTVKYRATLNDGRAIESCTFTHPEGTCTSGGGGSAAPAPGTNADVTFRHDGGNEWWVQGKIGGGDASNVAKVEAKDTGGSWKALENKGWGWAGSFHVEPGHLVTYRATLSDGRTVESCTFTHPQGVCSSGGTTTPPTTGTGFTATFENARGNEWWVEVNVKTSGGTLATVEAQVRGEWVTLSKTSWGSYAETVKTPAGTQVVFRATSTDGQTATSQPITWPAK